MTKLFVIECRHTYVIEAEDEIAAFEEMQEVDTYGTEVFESQGIQEATPMNMSKQWANLEPSNKFDGRKLKDIAPHLFGLEARK